MLSFWIEVPETMTMKSIILEMFGLLFGHEEVCSSEIQLN
jgi:hypothetical protein